MQSRIVAHESGEWDPFCTPEVSSLHEDSSSYPKHFTMQTELSLTSPGEWDPSSPEGLAKTLPLSSRLHNRTNCSSRVCNGIHSVDLRELFLEDSSSISALHNESNCSSRGPGEWDPLCTPECSLHEDSSSYPQHFTMQGRIGSSRVWRM
ncbi:hypothetical protein TNIN_233591 [Trichonephila inaurata madagascariensis]|uniref:Uncharacterized protein n=1 Tax=Trichonephila inaurata madagascariensis TaxID=2747483 RepID=A0A8X6WPX7_9ARAC|nr:hypothetical protein TNIN_233591 [Trichonephila inaurata madagascariensis]